ncbi:hypothetical protein [Epilithonimonas arachidiradicis]|uniref:DUF4350 domain-containing protein n=1 Tax=Epilithonimonas arachidiradicis TaxID=1617282 RepID=A0A420DDH0_9FLAO|nr:hypothetical protein [Epilithonimonas arachidiradicis]RKE89960.1 hypothetical protein BXY58_0543 [Epilithonimonas arachidiradicis]GGG46620.1 hypothetical protein GCM10007332_05200 [Epilithonimonas arachidiradicis]
MSKTFKIYAVIFIIILIVMGMFEMNKKPVLDWRKNYNVEKKTPFGLYIFDQESTALFKGKLEKARISPYAYYQKKQYKKPHNILIIQKKLDDVSWEYIMNEVANGSDVMWFTNNTTAKLRDTLGFRFKTVSFEDNYYLQLTDKKLTDSWLLIDKLPDNQGFSYIRSDIEILGKTLHKKNNNESSISADFVKINFGKGHFYVHSEPLILTNYYLLKSKNKYLESILSYLPDRQTVWFVETDTPLSMSPMRFILNNPPLRYAWYLLLLGLLIFVLFNAKRKQRIVPVIEPLKNTSLDFIRSIGNLYLQEGDFHEMMAKKAQYFLNRIRMDLLIDTQHLDEQFIIKLHLKTGKNIELIKEAVALVKKGQDPYASVMKEDLIKMNQLLDQILK